MEKETQAVKGMEITKKVTTESIDPEYFLDLLTGAMEGGSNYWCAVTREAVRECNDWHTAQGIDTVGVPAVDKIFNYVWNGFETFLIRTHDGDDLDEEAWPLNRFTVKKGFEKFANDYPEEWEGVKDGDWDADVADVWFQLTVLGEVTYG